MVIQNNRSRIAQGDDVDDGMDALINNMGNLQLNRQNPQAARKITQEELKVRLAQVENMIREVTQMDICQLRSAIFRFEPNAEICKVDSKPKFMLQKYLLKYMTQTHVIVPDELLSETNMVLKFLSDSKCAYADQHGAKSMNDDMIAAACFQWEMYALFDGHQGRTAVNALKNYFPYRILPSLVYSDSPEHVLVQEFMAFDARICKVLEKRNLGDRSCSVAALFYNVETKELYTVNIGSCKIVVTDSQGVPIHETPAHNAKNALKAGMIEHMKRTSTPDEYQFTFGDDKVFGNTGVSGGVGKAFKSTGSDEDKRLWKKIQDFQASSFFQEYLRDFNRIINNIKHNGSYVSKDENGNELAIEKFEKKEGGFTGSAEDILKAKVAIAFKRNNKDNVLRVLSQRKNTRAIGDAVAKIDMSNRYTSSYGLIGTQPFVSKVESLLPGNVYPILLGSGSFWAGFPTARKAIESMSEALSVSQSSDNDVCSLLVKKSMTGGSKPDNKRGGNKDDNVSVMVLQLSPASL